MLKISKLNGSLNFYSIELVSKDKAFDYVIATGKGKKDIVTVWLGENTADIWLK
ncbi:hypothetical protein CAR_50p080 (plasmid) [Carnobacterium sp. 17-4]|uniref:hypothetical protein n=1 Tax=Carnobacterium sp. (strain 17-4) TaxID=208596 RepID=UPI0002058482|nr:hypothetical protein [Carnobacterium sp. 17-4]AEB31180.1 hypothetical protein CAR_50p080 [Carnobacterium sp. 17-4]